MGTTVREASAALPYRYLFTATGRAKAPDRFDIEALRGNRLMLRGVGLNEKELSILGIAHAGE